MCGGDFVEVYSDPSQIGSIDMLKSVCECYRIFRFVHPLPCMHLLWNDEY